MHPDKWMLALGGMVAFLSYADAHLAAAMIATSCFYTYVRSCEIRTLLEQIHGQGRLDVPVNFTTLTPWGKASNML